MELYLHKHPSGCYSISLLHVHVYLNESIHYVKQKKYTVNNYGPSIELEVMCNGTGGGISFTGKRNLFHIQY